MNPFSSLISASLFYALPFLIGSAILKFRRKNLQERDTDITFVLTIRFFENYISGSFTLYLLAVVTDLILRKFPIGVHFTQAFVTAALALAGASFIYLVVMAFPTAAKDVLRKLNQKPRTNLEIPLFLLLLGIIIYSLWRWDSPLYTTLNWDLYEHQLLAEIISNGNFNFITSKLSDTFQFNSYSTHFHTMVSLAQNLVPANTLEFWWFLELFHLISTIFASYAVAYALSGSRKIALVSAIIGAFVFESFVSYTSLFLIPQNVAATVSAVFLARLVRRFEENAPVLDLPLVLFIPYILLNHLVIGSVGIALIAAVILFFWADRRVPSGAFRKTAIIVCAVLTAVIPIISLGIDLSHINRGEAAYFNFSLSEKLFFMKNFYGLSFILLMPLGTIVALRNGAIRDFILICATLGLLAFVIAEIPYSMKFFTLGRYLVHTVMALGFYAIIQRSAKVTQFMAVSLLTCLLALIFINNVWIFKQTPLYRELYTHVTPGEIEAANFIRERYKNQNVLLISEPATMFILEGLAGVNTPGGAYATIHTRQTLSKIWRIRDSETMAGDLFTISDLVIRQKPEKILIAVSGRFSKWQTRRKEDRFGLHWNVWRPRDLTLQEADFINYLLTYSRFSSVFKNESLILLEVEEPRL